MGNGIVVICGQFEPYAIVRLYKVDSETTLRAEGSPVAGERVVNANEEVGFEGLTPGERFIAAAYTRGRYEEVRCVAQDPAEGVTLLQPPVGPSPATLGTQGTSVLNTPAAPSASQPELGVGLPEGVSSPLLSGEPTPDPPPRADGEVSPGDVDGVGVNVGEAQPPVEQANPPAPEAGTPDASDSSGTGQANGGAVEESKAEVATPVAPVLENAPETVEAPPNVETPAPTVEAQSPPVESVPAEAPAEPSPEPPPAEPATEQGTPSANEPAPAPAEATPAPEAPVEPQAGAPAGAETPAAEPTDLEKLVTQATELGIDTANLSEAELRQAITEKNVTPVV